MAPDIKRDALKPGDHIYAWRWRSYAHHGICDETNRVIHFTASVQSSGPSIGSVASTLSKISLIGGCTDCEYRGQEGVVKTCLDCFLKGRKNINRYEYGVSAKQYKNREGGTCHTVVADKSRNLIIQRARYLLRHGFGEYSLTDNNCENFAIYCSTGQEGIISGQIDKKWTIIQWVHLFFASWFDQSSEEYTRGDIGDPSEGFSQAIKVRNSRGC